MVATLGNHEFFGRIFEETLEEARNQTVEAPNVHILDAEPSVEIDGYNFVGGCLFFDGSMRWCENDTLLPWDGWQDWRITDIEQRYEEFCAFYIERIRKAMKPNMPNVLCTHHLPHVALNGHALTFALDNYIGFGEITVAEGDHGKMVLSSGIVEWIRGGGSATGLDVEVTGDAAFKLGTGGNASFHDLTYSSTYWQKNGVAAYLAIYGTYTAGSVRPPLMMQDGSAIDLSAIDGVFDTSGTSVTHVASIVTGIAGQVAFVDKASIALDMGDRALVAGDCLLSWEAGTYPNAAFQFTLYTNGVAVAEVNVSPVITSLRPMSSPLFHGRK